ncbi:MAG: hypothetical protein Q8J61_02035 [Sulfuricella sp.]|nr:hypothetical protein [Sulfuricella sp.]
MNLKFWKKKKAPEGSGDSAADETIVATEADPAPAKPGFWTRLKSTLTPWRKKNKPDEEVEAEPSARRKDDKHQDEESEALPPKPGFLARMKNALLPRKKSEQDEEEEARPSAKRKDNKHLDDESETPSPKPGFLARLKKTLLPSRKKDKTEDEEKSAKLISSAKRTDRKHLDEEPESSDAPAEKPRKRLVIVLALLIPLAAGGGFFAAIKLLPPPQHQEAPPAKDTASQEAKADEQPAPEPAEAAEQAPQPEPGQPPTEPAPQQAGNATTPAAQAPEPIAEAPVADEDVQAQIQAMKKHNQEMQAQIEALKKQPAAEKKPARSAASAMPREGVLIINGKNAKESAQGLKKVIEDMNAASGAKDTGKK